MSMKLAKTIQFSICILNARTPLVEVSLSVPISSLTSPIIGKNWQTINVIANAINIFISRSRSTFVQVDYVIYFDLRHFKWHSSKYRQNVASNITSRNKH